MNVVNFTNGVADHLNRYRRIRTKVNASIFDSALSHTRRSEGSEKNKKILAFESSLVLVKV